MKIGFRSIHPVSTFIFYVFVFTLSLTAAHPVTLVSSLIAAFLYDIKLRGKRAVRFLIKFIVPLTVLSALINGLFNHSGVTPLFPLPGGNSFTLEAVVYGLIFALRADAVLMWLGSFNEVITNDRIIFLFGRLSPKIALVISMALRFIPLITQQSEEIVRAEKGIGAASASDRFTGRIRSGAKRLSVLVSWSLERGMDTQYSMLARGYGLKPRSTYNSYIFRPRDALLTVFTAMAATAYFITKDTLTALYNPVIIIPFPGIPEISVSVVLAVFMLLPLITDILEEKKWSISD